VGLAAVVVGGGVAVALLAVATLRRRPLPPVVFAVFDTTRADHLPIYGYPRNTTPNLAALARRALVFERAYASAPWTVPSHASLFTGRSAGRINVGWQQLRLPDGWPTMAESFREAGYFTVGISQNPLVSAKTGFARGFLRWANTVPGRAPALLAKLLRGRPPGRPLFLFLNLIAPHLPYSPPPRHRRVFLKPLSRRAAVLSRADWRALLRSYSEGRLSGDDLAILRDLYDGDLHWADSEFAEVVSAPGVGGAQGEAVIIAVSDHGENIGDHALFDHQLSVHNSLLHTLLVIFAPGRVRAGRVTTPVSLRNLWKTAADIVHLEGYEKIPGVSLLREQDRARDLPIISEYDHPDRIIKEVTKCCAAVDPRPYERELVAAQGENFKFVLSSNGAHEFYDLKSDPGERHNLFAKPPDQRAEGGLRRLRLAAESAAKGRTRGRAGLKASDLERLRALGYIR